MNIICYQVMVLSSKFQTAGQFWFTQQVAANPAAVNDLAQLFALSQRAQEISVFANGGQTTAPQINQQWNLANSVSGHAVGIKQVANTSNPKPPISAHIAVQPTGNALVSDPASLIRAGGKANDVTSDSLRYCSMARLHSFS